MENKTLKLAAVGDISLSGEYNDLLKEKSPIYPFIHVSPLLNDSDIIFGNLEGPLSTNGYPNLSKICLRGKPDAIKGLKYAGFNVVSLANNHIYDYGDDAFNETIDLLKKHNMNYVGVVSSLSDPQRCLTLNIKGLTITFLAYSCRTTNGQNYALTDKSGVVPLDMKIIQKDLEAVKAFSDFVIVSLHWGKEQYHYPSPYQIKMAHEIIDRGANLIIGHHPHVLQGVERYRDGLILYSLGNFLFADIDWKGDKSFSYMQKITNKETIILKCEIGRKKISAMEFIPVFINDCLQPEVCKDKKKQLILNKLMTYSSPLNKNDYKKFWKSLELSNFQNKKPKKIMSIERIRKIRKYRFADVKYICDLIWSYLKLKLS